VAKYGRGESAQAEQAQPADGASQQTEGPTTEERLTAELADMKDKVPSGEGGLSEPSSTRSSRERQEAVRYANADFARELLTILDDFETGVRGGRLGRNCRGSDRWHAYSV